MMLQQQWNKFIMQASELFLPLVDMTLQVVNKLLSIVNYFGKWGSLAAALLITVGGIVVGFKLLEKLAGRIGNVMGKVGGGAGKGIGGILGGIADGVKKFGSGQVTRGIANIALLGLAMIPVAYGFKQFSGVEWRSVMVGIVAMGSLVLIAKLMGGAIENIILGAVAIGLLSGAMWLAAKGFGSFGDVKWSSVFIGIGAISLLAIVAGIMGSFVPVILLGALAIAALGIAMIPFAAAAWITSKALQNLSEVNWKNIAQLFGVLALGGFVAPLAMMLGLAAPGIMFFSIALWALSKAAAPLGDTMVKLGTGFSSVVNGLKELQGLSLINTIKQINLLREAVIGLNNSLKGIPQVEFEKLKNMEVSLPAKGEVGGEEKTVMSDELKAIKNEIISLRKDISNPVPINLNIDSQLLATTSDRMTRFRKGYGVNDTSKIG
jgi:hypothetical protein